jgi:hypothetical protein
VVHQVTGEQGGAEIRDDFRKADEAQREGIVRQLVHVPADGNGDDLVGQDRADAVRQQHQEAAAAQR